MMGFILFKSIRLNLSLFNAIKDDIINLEVLICKNQRLL